MGDIIDLKGRRRGAEKSDEVSAPEIPVMDITNIRRQQIEYDRREVKRTVLNGFIGASVLVQGRGLLRVSVFDISRGGLSFDMSSQLGQFREGEEIAIRFYFSHNVYFPFFMKITSIRISPEDGISRHGATFVQERSNMDVLHSFVDFLETVVTDLKNDKGDLFINEFGS